MANTIALDFTAYLPTEVVVEILFYLKPADLCRLAQCSKSLFRFAMDNVIWSELCKARWEKKIGLEEALRTEHPLWWKVLDGWKRAYMVVEIESKRKRPKEDDLVESKWCFRFNNYPSHFAAYPIFRRDRTTEIIFQYLHDQEYTDVIDWRLTRNGYVQVADYPPLRITRNSEDFSWHMHNIYVEFVASESSGFQRAFKRLNIQLETVLQKLEGSNLELEPVEIVDEDDDLESLQGDYQMDDSEFFTWQDVQAGGHDETDEDTDEDDDDYDNSNAEDDDDYDDDNDDDDNDDYVVNDDGWW